MRQVQPWDLNATVRDAMASSAGGQSSWVFAIVYVGRTYGTSYKQIEVVMRSKPDGSNAQIIVNCVVHGPRGGLQTSDSVDFSISEWVMIGERVASVIEQLRLREMMR